MATAQYTCCMFLWRWFKRLVVVSMLAGAAYVVGGYVEWRGKPARDQVIGFFQSPLWHEGVKDLRTWLGALLQLAGKKMEEGVTPEDQRQLDAIIESDLKKQIEGAKAQAGTAPTNKTEEKKE